MKVPGEVFALLSKDQQRLVKLVDRKQAEHATQEIRGQTALEALYEVLVQASMVGTPVEVLGLAAGLTSAQVRRIIRTH